MNHLGDRRTHWITQYGLDEPRLAIVTPDAEVTLHQRPATGEVWWINLSPYTHSVSLGPVGGGVGWMADQSQNYRFIFGLLPPAVASVEVTLREGTAQTPQVDNEVFLTAVPLGQSVTVTFKDEVGQVIDEQQFPAWHTPSIGWFRRSRRALLRLAQNLNVISVPRDMTTISPRRKI